MMASKQIKNLSLDELNQRWCEHIKYIGEEVNYIAGERVNYRLIQNWLFNPLRRQWVNRHLQAYGWISRLWLTECLMFVRRQLDGQHGSISLKQLLHEIEARPEISISPKGSDIAADRLALEQSCEGALKFAQRQLAHSVAWDDGFVSLGDVDAALDSIDHVVRKYHVAIAGQDLTESQPEPDPDWLRSFEVAWNRRRRTDTRSRRSAPTAGRKKRI